LGVFLSGGVDSRAIAAVAAVTANPTAITLTFPDDQGLNEGPQAARFAAELGMPHVQIPITDFEGSAAIAGAFSALDQPTYDGFNSQLLASATAQAGIVVALSGLGGDELFGGYGMESLAARNRKLSRTARVVPSASRRVIGGWASRWSPGSGLARLLPANDELDIYQGTRGVFDRAYVKRLYGEAVYPPTKWPGEKQFADSISVLDWQTYLASQLLRDTDNASMRYSVEVRVPILSNRLLDASLSVESVQRLKLGKAALMAAGGLTDAQEKRGFVLPYERWLAGPMADMLREGLLSQDLPLSEDLSLDARQCLFDAYLAGRVHWMRPWLVCALRFWAAANDCISVAK
jgi:asparagine synthase (glutamine-hydrolysing)